MPIRIETTVDIAIVTRQLSALEKRYAMSSEEFTADPALNRSIPADDAIEWEFLLMQRSALEDKDCHNGFSAVCKSDLQTQETRTVYEQVAA